MPRSPTCHTEGAVFLSDKARPYVDRRGAYGGQVRSRKLMPDSIESTLTMIQQFK